MDVQDYLTAIRSGVNVIGVEWQTEVKPAAKWRKHTLTKISRAVAMGTGDDTEAAMRNARVQQEMHRREMRSDD